MQTTAQDDVLEKCLGAEPGNLRSEERVLTELDSKLLMVDEISPA